MPYDLTMTTTTPSADNLKLVRDIRSRQLPSRARRRQIREAAGATISEVADACGVTYFSVWAWERPDGTIEPRPAHRLTYRRILDALEALAHELGDDLQK